MTPEERKRFKVIHHVVHEYANFVSSAEMVLTGVDIYGEPFEPPINTHLSHAFYLNCRKLADFFQNRRYPDDVKAEHFVPGHRAKLPVFDSWRTRIDKQLAHVTYTRDTAAREIRQRTQRALYKELRAAWRQFRKKLPRLYGDQFTKKVSERKAPDRKGRPSEFRFYDLD
jgi:hypothetical protein